MKNVENAKLTEIKKFLESNGLKMPSGILSVESDSKTSKGKKYDYLTGICYLMPSDTICPASKLAKCKEPCLVTTGLAGVYASINEARRNKTRIFEQFPNVFYELVRRDIKKLERKAERENKRFCVRLNGTSDIDHSDFIASMPHVQFYDYTKRVQIADISTMLDNYNVTFSYSGANPRYEKHVRKALEIGVNIAVVFREKELPSDFMGLPVINGDETDLRFLDYKVNENQSIVGLYAKGKAKQDQSGFVVDSNIIARG